MVFTWPLTCSASTCQDDTKFRTFRTTAKTNQLVGCGVRRLKVFLLLKHTDSFLSSSFTDPLSNPQNSFSKWACGGLFLLVQLYRPVPPPHSCLSISWISILCLWRFINYSNPPQFLLLSSCTAVWPLISLFSCTFCTRWTISRTRQHNAALMLDITEEYHGAESTVCKDPSSDGHSMVILRVCYGVTDSNEETDPE